jgi:cation diffusion facilitator family transporter
MSRHSHDFLGEDHDRNARRTWLVIALTTAMMVAEIAGGVWFGSMALLADGWHMFTHAGALLISAGAYWFAKRHRQDSRFTYGTGKVGDLAAFTSAIVLALVAVLILFEAAVRIVDPVVIDFDEAIAVAVVGLVVNAVSALLLRDTHHHEAHGHGHGHHHGGHAHNHGHSDGEPAHGHAHHDPAHRHGHGPSGSAGQGHDHRRAAPGHGHDSNLRAAYLHVVADAFTSILAILALLGGKLLGWSALDPLTGAIGAVVILVWSRGLLRTAARTLLDMVPDPNLERAARERLERTGAEILDLHLWRLGPGHVGLSVALKASVGRPVQEYRGLLESLPGVSHVTVEVTSPGAR